jgi:hypothetical protein
MAKISLDYDATFTADPELWLEFIKTAKTRGHEIYCVTARFDWEADSMDARLKEAVRVIFCDRQAKRTSAEKAGIKIDIWIDDVPENITNILHG